MLVAVRHNWGEDRVFFLDEEGTQCSLLRGWTLPQSLCRTY